MDLATFEDHLDRYGGALGAWPEAVRGDAEALLAASGPARKAHDAMRAVELALASSRTPGDARRGDAMAAVATRHRQSRPVDRLAPRAGWAAAAAAVLVLGIAVGTVAPRLHDDSPERVMAAALDTSGAIDAD